MIYTQEGDYINGENWQQKNRMDSKWAVSIPTNFSIKNTSLMSKNVFLVLHRFNYYKNGQKDNYNTSI